MKHCFACLVMAAALGAAACEPAPLATSPEAMPPVDPLTATPRQPAPWPSQIDSAVWQFDTDGADGRPRLRYASFGVEDQALNLQCEDETIYAILLRGEQKPAWPFSLQAGGAQAELSGAGVGESEVVVTATLPLNAPVLDNFDDTGALTLTEGGFVGVLDAQSDAERATIRRFFEACT